MMRADDTDLVEISGRLNDIERDVMSRLVRVERSLNEIEKSVILKTLQQVNGNRTLAAERLNISTRTIRNKLHRYAAEAQR